MSTAYHACTCHLILLILIYCFYSSEVTAQCVMEDRVGFQGIDTLGNVITSASGSDFQVCKDYCLATDACLAVEFRGGVACTAWTEDPQLSVEAGNTISVKVCTPDGVDTSFTTILQTSSEQQMALPATNLDMPSTNDFPSSTEPVFDSTSSSSYKLLPSETTTNAVIPQQTPSHTLATSTDYDDLTVGTMVLQTPEESQQIRTTMTSEIPTASDLITSSDHISPTESVTVSVLTSELTTSSAVATFTTSTVTTAAIATGLPSPRVSISSTEVSTIGHTASTSSTQATTSSAKGLLKSGSITFVFTTPTPSLGNATDISSLVSSTSSTPSSTQSTPAFVPGVIEPTITLVNGSSKMPDQDSSPSSASSEPSTEVIVLSAVGAFVICTFVTVGLVLIYRAWRPGCSSKPKGKDFANSSLTRNGVEKSMPHHSKMIYPEYKSFFIAPKEPENLYHIPRPMLKI